MYIVAREPYTNKWKRGRVVEGTSLLTKQTERFREFESLRFRQTPGYTFP